jgi:hypothetical protein
VLTGLRENTEMEIAREDAFVAESLVICYSYLSGGTEGKTTRPGKPSPSWELSLVPSEYESGTQSTPMTFNLFRSRTPRYILSTIVYPQNCWCTIQAIHSP